MNQGTKRLTTGAMFTAIFGILLLINRQTGGLFEELVIFLLPVPMVGFTSKYGWRSGLPAYGAMCLLSLIFSTPTGIFYAVTEAAIGLYFGSRVYAKKDMTKTLLGVMGLSALVNVLNTIVLAALFGYDLNAEVAEYQAMLTTVFQKTSVDPAMTEMLLTVLTPQFLLRVIVISMVFLGLLQGFVIFELSLVVLRRVGFQVPKPQSVFEYYPPKWTGVVALVLYFGYTFAAGANITNRYMAIGQLAGMCGYLYLLCFGYLATMLLVRKYLTKNRLVISVIAILGFLMLPMGEMILGALYTVTDYHKEWMQA